MLGNALGLSKRIIAFCPIVNGLKGIKARLSGYSATFDGIGLILYSRRRVSNECLVLCVCVSMSVIAVSLEGCRPCVPNDVAIPICRVLLVPIGDEFSQFYIMPI